MKQDIEIAREAKLETIDSIANKLGLCSDLLIPFGCSKAKVAVDRMDLSQKKGKIILVTAMSPTPAGEGKTTMAIGLSMALCKLGKNAVVGLREPSLGPVFGIKGGAAGGGHSQVLPMEDINLHFTGDLHAITSSNNLLSALINNSMHYGNEFNLDSRRIFWSRVLDMNDRSLRQVVVGLGGRDGGMVDEDNFDITAASEVMAILCLCSNPSDLKDMLGHAMVGLSMDRKPVYCKDMKAAGPMAVLLKDAIKPNLVQTIEGTPAIIHGGPFANIAHGTSSLIGARLGLNLADYYVTEAGFGSDLGGEKFFDIFSRKSELPISAVVIVATIRALKYHGGVGKKELGAENVQAMEKGFVNLQRHIENIKKFGWTPVVALNVFGTDTEAEINMLKQLCTSHGSECIPSNIHTNGSEGGLELAKAVLSKIDEKMPNFAYPLDIGLREKIEMLATSIYRAGSVVFSPFAKRQMNKWEELGYANLPVCLAKTQYSFSDNPKLLGAPDDFELHISEVKISTGAGFVIPIAGEITRMPGLPRHPSAEFIDIDEKGNIVGLF
ncbi:MAG: formate--tetrahydrofolate ligase [Thermoplasmata archaeon]|nr:formate--tetrahydrofolate ligase [Thermoplasmata archaeon]